MSVVSVPLSALFVIQVMSQIMEYVSLQLAALLVNSSTVELVLIVALLAPSQLALNVSDHALRTTITETDSAI